MQKPFAHTRPGRRTTLSLPLYFLPPELAMLRVQSTWRPLARRRLSTLRPLAVAMRARKPEVLADFRLVPSLVQPIDFLELATTTRAPRRAGATRMRGLLGELLPPKVLPLMKELPVES